MRSLNALALLAFALCLMQGCTDILSSLRQESAAIDEEADRDREPSEPKQAAEGGGRPRNLRGLSANNVAELEPPATRAYRRKLGNKISDAEDTIGEAVGERRHTRGDFVDRAAHENSLWDGQGQNNYLFANNRRRESGDMITVDVERELRREIQYQLWLTLPPEQRKSKKGPEKLASGTDAVTNAAGAPQAAKDGAAKGAEKSQETKNKDAAEEAAKTNLAQNPAEPDVLKMEVVENLGNGLVRVLGQKRVVYKGQSKLVEVAALVNNKDLNDANHMKSSNFLDTKAQVIQ